MDKFPLKNGFHKDVSLYESTAGAHSSENLCYLDNSEISDSALLNQSTIISGNVNINHGIHDVSSYTNEELNINIDALMLDKNEKLMGDSNDVDLLNGNVVETLKSYYKNSEISDSALLNQSTIISGTVNVNRGIYDVSNYTNEELNINIDALMLDKKEQFLENNNGVDLLSGNLEETLKSNCKPGQTLLIPSNKSDFNKSKDLNTVETLEVEVTSREESNGKFRVHFHIKGFKKN